MITREELKAHCERTIEQCEFWARGDNKKLDNSKLYQEHKLILELLEQEPCEDAVSRQTVKEQMIKYGFLAPDMTVTEFVEDLSPVSPWKSKIGHWFIDERPESDREVICSNCDQPILKYHKLDFDYRPNYCPNCGAKMVEPAESEEQT